MDPSGAPTITVSGELDITNVAELKVAIEWFARDEPHQVILDLSGLRFIDSSGIGLLVYAAERVPSIQPREPSAVVRRLVELTGLTAVLTVEP